MMGNGKMGSSMGKGFLRREIFGESRIMSLEKKYEKNIYLLIS